MRLETGGLRTISHGLMELRLGEVKDLGHKVGRETSVGRTRGSTWAGGLRVTATSEAYRKGGRAEDPSLICLIVLQSAYLQHLVTHVKVWAKLRMLSFWPFFYK